MPTQPKVTPTQDPIISKGSIADVAMFTIDGSVYLHAHVLDGPESKSRPYLFKFKSKKLGFVKYQNLTRPVKNSWLEGLSSEAIPFYNNGIETQVLKIGKISYLLTYLNVLIPFMVSPNPLLKRAGKLLSAGYPSNYFTTLWKNLLPDTNLEYLIQNYDNRHRGQAATVQFKAGGLTFAIMPLIKTVSAEYNGYPLSAPSVCIPIYIYNKKAATWSKLQNLEDDIQSIHVGNSKALSAYAGCMLSQRDYSVNKFLGNIEGNGPSNYPAYYKPTVIDMRSDVFIVLPDVGCDYFKNSDTGNRPAGAFSSMYVFKYSKKFKKFEKTPFSEIYTYWNDPATAGACHTPIDGYITRNIVSVKFVQHKKTVLMFTVEQRVKDTKEKEEGIWCTQYNFNAKVRSGKPTVYNLGSSKILDLTEKKKDGYFINCNIESYLSPPNYLCYRPMDPLAVYVIKNKKYLFLPMNRATSDGREYKLEAYKIDDKVPTSVLSTPILEKTYTTKWGESDYAAPHFWIRAPSYSYYDARGKKDGDLAEQQGSMVFNTKAGVFYVRFNYDQLEIDTIKL